jgi:hypothetical protein
MKRVSDCRATIRRLERERWRKRVVQIRAYYYGLLIDSDTDNACLQQMYSAVDAALGELAKEMGAQS